MRSPLPAFLAVFLFCLFGTSSGATQNECELKFLKRPNKGIATLAAWIPGISYGNIALTEIEWHSLDTFVADEAWAFHSPITSIQITSLLLPEGPIRAPDSHEIEPNFGMASGRFVVKTPGKTVVINLDCTIQIEQDRLRFIKAYLRTIVREVELISDPRLLGKSILNLRKMIGGSLHSRKDGAYQDGVNRSNLHDLDTALYLVRHENTRHETAFGLYVRANLRFQDLQATR